MHRRKELSARYGLIGKKLGHSFSPAYFKEKFKEENINASYELFELEKIDDIEFILNNGIDGLNVTLPYKSAILPYLDGIDPKAEQIGAVNCIANEDGKFIGYNTDWIGFTKSLLELIGDVRPEALVLGNGGASKAVQFSLSVLGIKFHVVNRMGSGMIYSMIDKRTIQDNLLIINTTPLGMHPNDHEKPPIPYEWIGDQHFLLDLIYNPKKTLFLASGEQQGAKIQNGLPMLVYQAEASWEIWNTNRKK